MRLRLPVFFLAALLSAQEWSKIDRIVAVGDVHGDFNQFTSLLRGAGVIDRDNHWSGGKTHLVQDGDVVDRGPESRKCLDLLMALEKEAAAAGGAVHALIGNHETMDMYGDLRYVSPAEFAAFRSDRSESIRDMYYKQQLKELPRPPDNGYRAKWESAHPLGYFEQRTAFAPDGIYGKWIRGHFTIIRLNDLIFLHAGIAPKYAKQSIKKVNEEVSKELQDFRRLEGGMIMDPDGPLWYRGLAQDAEGPLEEHVRGVLERLGAKTIVVGHTVTKGMITPRFDGQVLLIDTGISQVYGGRPACLIVEDGKRYALHRGNRVELPANMGADLARYMKQVNAIDLSARP